MAQSQTGARPPGAPADQTAVHRRHEGDAQPPQQRKVHPVHVTVDDVEIRRSLGDDFKQCGMGGGRVRAGPPEPKRARPCRDQCCSSDQIAASKQGHLVSKFH